MLKWRTPTRTSRTCCPPRARFLQLGWREPDLRVPLEPPPRQVVEVEVPSLLATVMDRVVPPGRDTTAVLELLLRTGTDRGDQEVLAVPGDLEDHLDLLDHLEDLEDLHLTAGTDLATVEDRASILPPLTATCHQEVR